MGVSLMDKDSRGSEGIPQDLIMNMSPPQKRQKMKANSNEGHPFQIARRARQKRESGTGVSWDKLPDELLLGIFYCLPLADLLKVSQVCKRWRCLAFDETLWHSIDLTNRILLPGAIGQVLSAGVVVLRCARACVGKPLFKNARPLRVQHVDLSNCTISVVALQDIMSHCCRLQNLTLEGLALSDDVIRSISQNFQLIRLNLCGCSGFSAESLKEMLGNCSRLEELNLSWCDFTSEHVKAATQHLPKSTTQLNLSGYRQNLNISDIQALVESCPRLTNLDLSDSVMLTSDCFPYFEQLFHLQHLSLSRCYQIPPAALVKLGNIPTLKTLNVFGIVPDSYLPLLKETLPHIKINLSHFTAIGRPTLGNKNRNIWGMKCRLAFTNSILH
nr:PREDICTED: S-phase kinase-associated protein 2 isoform X2 [Latimeria chalumnae]|eukprot:XP_014346653.1 PREDICTED: S-phase kinase-associated protein 2 isoform X2 [Latimeria chalumnae]